MSCASCCATQGNHSAEIVEAFPQLSEPNAIREEERENAADSPGESGPPALIEQKKKRIVGLENAPVETMPPSENDRTIARSEKQNVDNALVENVPLVMDIDELAKLQVTSPTVEETDISHAHVDIPAHDDKPQAPSADVLVENLAKFDLESAGDAGVVNNSPDVAHEQVGKIQKCQTKSSREADAIEGTFMEVVVVFLRCMALATISVAVFIVVCILPLSAGVWFFDESVDLASKVHDLLPPSAVEEGKVKRILAPNISMAILLQTLVQVFANPMYIVMQMRALCGFWGIQDPVVMIPNILYALWIIITPLFMQEYFWYYWIDFSVGALYVVVEAIYAYRMIGASAKDVGSIDTGNEIIPFEDRPEDMTGKMSPAACIVFSSSWVIAAVYVIVPMTVAGWLGATTSYADSDLGGKLVIVFVLQLLFMITIPIVRVFLNRYSPLGATADMLILMHPQIHKSISSRMLISSLDSVEDLVITCVVLSTMEII